MYKYNHTWMSIICLISLSCTLAQSCPYTAVVSNTKFTFIKWTKDFFNEMAHPSISEHMRETALPIRVWLVHCWTRVQDFCLRARSAGTSETWRWSCQLGLTIWHPFSSMCKTFSLTFQFRIYASKKWLCMQFHNYFMDMKFHKTHLCRASSTNRGAK
jgi:hypothetical protein